MRSSVRPLACLAALLSAGGALAEPARLSLQAFEERPRLVLVLVVDQLRADYLTRFSSRFLPARTKGGAPGGYRFLMERGAFFPFAEYGLLQAMTGPGHATVLTGAHPYRSGIALNTWCESTPSGMRPVYCVEDPGAPLVGAAGSSARQAGEGCAGPLEPGVSPRKLVATTVGDELKSAGLQGRVVSVALKDRAAVLLGGHHADLALWFDPQGWAFVTSRYYAPGGTLPDWVAALNQKIRARRGEELRFAPTGRSTGRTEGGAFEISPRIGTGASLKTPYGLELTVDAALAAVGALELGSARTDPDLLALSFSSHDYLGHDLGPNRLELEEMTLAEDRELARLFGALAQRLPRGLDDALIVLTGDHGVSPAPGFLLGLADRGPAAAALAGYLDADALRAQADAALAAQWGPAPRGSWVGGTVDLNFWLDRAALEGRGIAPEVAEKELARTLRRLVPEAQFAVTRTEVTERRVPGGALGEHLLRGYRPGVSGDVVLIARPSFIPAGDVDNHFTDYAFDRTVPLLLSGRRVRPGVYPAGAQLVDLAPTLSFLLGVVPPALSEGRVLAEALEEPQKARRAPTKP